MPGEAQKISSEKKDVIEFMIAGSSAVQIGTLNFIDPSAPGKIVKELGEYCMQNGIKKISDLTASYLLNENRM